MAYVELYKQWNFVSSAVTMTGKILDQDGDYDQMHVSRGGIAKRTTVNEDGRICVDGGTADQTTVNAGGDMYVYDGTATNTTVSSGGSITFSGEGNTPCGVGVDLKSGASLEIHYGIVSQVRISSGAVARMDVSNAGYGGIYGQKVEIISATVYGGGILSAEVERKYSGRISAIVSSAVISSGGSVIIDERASAVETLLSSGGIMEVRDLGHAEQSKIKGGTLYVLAGGEVTETEIFSKGKLMLSGKATDTTVNSGGALFVGFGAAVQNITVNGTGGVYVATGGEIKGNISISQSGGLYLYGGSIVDGEIHVQGTLYVDESMVSNGHITIGLNSASPTAVKIRNLDYLGGTESFTVETAAAGFGNYTLATGASDYDGTVTVCDNGTEFGDLSIGETKTFGNASYTLSKKADALSLSILKAVVTVSAKSDVDGNGISDVLFQWTGGNFATGYWMNGTSNWRCANASHPAEWELLGARDMSGDGKADSVFVGNVEVAGVKGAYIGYYQDGVDTDDNWVNIGYLNNAEDITWVNKIGNLTGNPDGKNSIVWHAAELGAAGVWTDGTDNWIAISGYFGKGWELEGTGDFNGDGKDEILWRYEGGLYTSDIDSNFTSLGSCGTEWQVRAVGDFSGDGTDDIVIFHKETGLVAKLENGLAANFEAIGQLDADDWFVVGAGNYNNDSQEDLLVRQYSTGMLGYYVGANISSWVELGRGVNMDWTVIA